MVALFVGEDAVDFGGGDGDRSLGILDLVVIDKRWVRRVASIQSALVGTEVAEDILAAEAITYATDFLEA